MRVSEISTPSATGSAPPDSPEPAPRATQGTPRAVAGAHHGRHLLGRARQHHRAPA